MGFISDTKFGWTKPYRWRTNLRAVLPWFMNGWFHKGEDCERVGSHHDWYKIDGMRSGCYHCDVIRDGELWRTESSNEADEKALNPRIES
jgi:hypothetical protein